MVSFQYEERKCAVIQSLSDHFSCTELLTPVEYREKDWSKETYNGGCPVDIVTPGAMKYYNELSTPFMRYE